jgi:hypothetical protein
MLETLTTPAEFESYVAAAKPPLFLRYRELASEKRADFNAALRACDIDLRGKGFLDIGPAHGESLDLAREQGATTIEFVEFDPFFFAYNRLKPHARGYQLDHRRHLRRLPERRFDLIWCKGGFSPEYFLRFGWITSLEKWIADVERMARPGATVLICPGWTNDGARRNIADTRDNPFTRKMEALGYAILPFVQGHNHEPDYPVTFFKHIRER